MPLPKGQLTRRKGNTRKAVMARQGQTGAEEPQPAVPAAGNHPEAAPVPATPLKSLSSISITVPALEPVSPVKSCSGPTSLEIPARLSHWKLHCVGSKITLNRLLAAESVPDEYPPIHLTHVLSFFDGKWQLWVHGKSVAASLGISFPEICTSSSLEKLLTDIEILRVCEGVTDSSLLALVDEQVHRAFLDYVPTVDRNGMICLCTARDADCELLLSGQMIRCHKCTNLKDRLRYKAHRESSQTVTDASKFTANIHLSTPEKLKKLATLAVDKAASKKRIASLSTRIQALNDKSSLVVDPELDADLAAIMVAESDTVQPILPEGSFRKLFWQQQMKALSCKDPRQRRWHPLMIKWCLNLKLISSAAYHNLQASGMLVLPSARTLRDYSNVVTSAEGFSHAVIQQLHDEARQGQDSIPYHRRFVGVLFDEIYIQEDLVYDRHSARLIGFVNLGEVDSQISAMEVAASASSPQVATRILTLMVRGIFCSLHFPLANFPTAGVTGISLFDIMWEATEHLERSDFIVSFQTGDGCSPNRRYYRMHRDSGITHKTINPYSVDNKTLFFFSDAPHLLKTARNSLSHSGYNRSRLLWINDLTLEWKHIEDLYKMTAASAARSMGLKLAHKLTREHVYLTSYSHMRVDLAAQVLSKTTSEALGFYAIPGSAATQTFLIFMDRFFDMMNVRHPNEFAHKRKEELKPYTSPDDERLKWLEDGFLGYIDRWESSVQERQGFTPAEKELMLLSRETREGLRITVMSLTGIVRELLSDPGLTKQYILTARFNQDPLENFFGRVRQSGGWSSNPSSKRVQESTNLIRLQSSSMLDEVRSSAKTKKRIFGDEGPKIDDTPLPKRRRK